MFMDHCDHPAFSHTIYQKNKFTIQILLTTFSGISKAGYNRKIRINQKVISLHKNDWNIFH